MSEVRPLKVKFYITKTGKEPVREWLKSLSTEEKKIIGEDIKTAQFGWPLGMLLIKKLEKGIWEVRSSLKDKIARVVLTKVGVDLVLLHGFIKKTQKIPEKDLNIARERLKDMKG